MKLTEPKYRIFEFQFIFQNLVLIQFKAKMNRYKENLKENLEVKAMTDMNQEYGRNLSTN